MLPGAMEPLGVADLVASALDPVRGRPARAYSSLDRGSVNKWGVERFGRAHPGERSILSSNDWDNDPTLRRDAFSRLFDTKVGHIAADLIGNETRTLDVVQTLTIDLLHDAALKWLRMTSPRAASQSRALFVPAGDDDRPPSLLLLTADHPPSDARRITGEVEVDAEPLDIASEQPRSDEQQVRAMILSDPAFIRDAMRIAQPEVVLARMPKMERLSVPSTLVCVESLAERSTAGLYCRDSDGTLGVTACFHGTGPVGTKVTIDGRPCEVTQANVVQDIVFIPLPEGYSASPADGLAGVMRDRAPSQYLGARFHGLTSGPAQTSIVSHDAGLLRPPRPTVQLKVQTGADTDKGDSGSALIDRDGNILGFAFEKSAFGETPQITDWIWAANALASLGLQPI